MFSKQNPADQELLNWSAVRGSNTDFNTNSRVNANRDAVTTAAYPGDNVPERIIGMNNANHGCYG
jgi:hypothetical protein